MKKILLKIFFIEQRERRKLDNRTYLSLANAACSFINLLTCIYKLCMGGSDHDILVQCAYSQYKRSCVSCRA